MSDPVLQRCNDSVGKSEQSMQSYHSAWVSHWTKKSHDAAIQNHICPSTSSGNKEHDHGNKGYLSMTKLETASNTYAPVEGKIETGNTKVTDDSLRTASTAIRNENLAFHSFPTDIPCQNGGTSSALKDGQVTCNRDVSGPQIKLNLDSDEPALSINLPLFPVAPDAKETSSRDCHPTPDYAEQNGKQPVKTLELFRDGGFALSRPWAVDSTASTSHVVQHGFDHGDDRTTSLPSHIGRPASASKEQLQHTNFRFLGGDYQRHSAILVSEDSQSKTERSDTPCLWEDKGSFSQTNPSTCNNHSPAFGGEQFQNIQNFSGFRLNRSKQPEGNCMVDKGKKVAQGIIFDSNLKNESSAETDIMELDEYGEKNQLFAANSSPSNKVIRFGSIAPRLALGSAREVGYAQYNSELHGMDFELPALPAAGKMLDNGEPSTSRTQSLDMETLLANAEQLSHSESEHHLDGSAKPDPSCIWVKRLKLTASDSFVGTKSTNSGPSDRKNNSTLARSLKGSMANSEPTVNRYHGKELMLLDKTTTLSRNGESFSSETSKDRDSLLLHSWIQRWRNCQSATPKKKPEAVVVCEPQSSKVTLEDLQRKEFPSIAAMALMGKAMSGFQPCQFQKKGSVVVWN